MYVCLTTSINVEQTIFQNGVAHFLKGTIIIIIAKVCTLRQGWSFFLQCGLLVRSLGRLCQTLFLKVEKYVQRISN